MDCEKKETCIWYVKYKWLEKEYKIMARTILLFFRRKKIKKFLSRFSIRSSKVDRYSNEKSKKSVWFKVWKW